MSACEHCGKPAVWRLVHAIREHEHSLHVWFVDHGIVCEDCRNRWQRNKPWPLDFRPVADELPASY